MKSRRGLGPVSLEQVSVRLREGLGFLKNVSSPALTWRRCVCCTKLTCSCSCSWGTSCSSCLRPASAPCCTSCCSWEGARPEKGELCRSWCICCRPGGSRGSCSEGAGDSFPESESLKVNSSYQKNEKKILLSTVVVPAVANNEIHCSLFGYFDNFQFNLDLNCFRDLAVLCKIIPLLTSRSPCLPGRESWLRSPLHCGAA